MEVGITIMDTDLYRVLVLAVGITPSDDVKARAHQAKTAAIRLRGRTLAIAPDVDHDLQHPPLIYGLEVKIDATLPEGMMEVR